MRISDWSSDVCSSDLPPYACPLSTCMAVLGGAWTPNVIWNLSGGPRRFSELRHDIPKVYAKVLTARLRALEAKVVVIREVKPTSPPSVEYSHTDLGQQLVPAITRPERRPVGDTVVG